MSFVLDPLPYAQDALAPHISANTISFHYGKHHAGYVNKLNELTKGTPYETQSLTDVVHLCVKRSNQKDYHSDQKSTVKNTFGNPATVAIFNNAAQNWNHTFYWRSMKQQGGGPATGQVKDLILQSFDSLDSFSKAFTDAALSQFGSGWTWLVEKDGKVSIVKTSNADNPITSGYNPLITLDVWEHAYYLDFQNRRVDYANLFLTNLVNWDYANQNLVNKAHL